MLPLRISAVSLWLILASCGWGQSSPFTTNAPDDAPKSADAGVDAWRYRWHNNHWWYWTASDKWVIYDKDAWVPYDAESYPLFYRRFNRESRILHWAFPGATGYRPYSIPIDGYERVRAFGLRQDMLNLRVLGTGYGGYGSELGGYGGYRSSTGANIGGGVGGSFGSGQGSYFGSGIGRGIGPRP